MIPRMEQRHGVRVGENASARKEQTKVVFHSRDANWVTAKGMRFLKSVRKTKPKKLAHQTPASRSRDIYNAITLNAMQNSKHLRHAIQ